MRSQQLHASIAEHKDAIDHASGLRTHSFVRSFRKRMADSDEGVMQVPVHRYRTTLSRWA